LRQSFQLAGADAVLASLWEVPDDDTTEFMKMFWRNLADGQTKSAAMQNAQLGMTRKLRDEGSETYPYRWAAFTLTGE
jgi:CHAT domain-containing protein